VVKIWSRISITPSTLYFLEYLVFRRDNPFIAKQFITKWLKIFNKNILKSFYNDSVPIYYLLHIVNISLIHYCNSATKFKQLHTLEILQYIATAKTSKSTKPKFLVMNRFEDITELEILENVFRSVPKNTERARTVSGDSLCRFGPKVFKVFLHTTYLSEYI
jgi:hypothetical protein